MRHLRRLTGTALMTSHQARRNYLESRAR